MDYRIDKVEKELPMCSNEPDRLRRLWMPRPEWMRLETRGYV